MGDPDPWALQPHPRYSGLGNFGSVQATSKAPLPILLLDVFLPMPVRDVWHTLLVDPGFQGALARRRNNSNLQLGPWRLLGALHPSQTS